MHNGILEFLIFPSTQHEAALRHLEIDNCPKEMFRNIGHLELETIVQTRIFFVKCKTDLSHRVCTKV